MTPKLYKAADVCELTQLQPYVLRSWEKEFPGIGVQKSGDGPRLYRQSDIDQVQRIKQLVFGEGLTLSGARRRLETQAPVAAVEVAETEDDDVMETLAADARQKISTVRDGLRLLLDMVSRSPGHASGVRRAGPAGQPGPSGPSAGDYELQAPTTTRTKAAPPQRALATRGKAAPPARRTTPTGKKTKRASV